jgi:hypothetical protein
MTRYKFHFVPTQSVASDCYPFLNHHFVYSHTIPDTTEGFVGLLEFISQDGLFLLEKSDLNGGTRFYQVNIPESIHQVEINKVLDGILKVEGKPFIPLTQYRAKFEAGAGDDSYLKYFSRVITRSDLIELYFGYTMVVDFNNPVDFDKLYTC